MSAEEEEVTVDMHMERELGTGAAVNVVVSVGMVARALDMGIVKDVSATGKCNRQVWDDVWGIDPWGEEKVKRSVAILCL